MMMIPRPATNSNPDLHPVGLELAAGREEQYGGRVRVDALALLSRPLGRVLDVGCARGMGASIMRQLGATYLAGVEINEEFAADARNRYDEVLVSSAELELAW